MNQYNIIRVISWMIAMAGAFGGLLSCSQDVVVETPPQTDIHFRIGVEGSRAMETTTDNLQKFDVKGYLIMPDGESLFYDDFVTYKKKDVGDKFLFQSLRYFWPEDNTGVKFYAFAPSGCSDIKPQFIFDKDGYLDKKGLGFKCINDLSRQVDFIVAEAAGSKNVNGQDGMTLMFHHLESQVIVKAKNANSAYTCEISGVRIGRVKSKGTYNFATPASGSFSGEWEDLNTTDTYTWIIPSVMLGTTEQTLMSDGMKTVAGNPIMGNPMIIAQTTSPWNRNKKPKNTAGEKNYGPEYDNYGAYLAVKVKIISSQTENSNSIELFPSGYSNEWAAVPLDFEFEPGKCYTFVLDFSVGAGNVAPPVPTDPTKPDDPTLPDDDPDKPTYPDPDKNDENNDKDSGEPILGEIRLTVTITPWGETKEEDLSGKTPDGNDEDSGGEDVE